MVNGAGIPETTLCFYRFQKCIQLFGHLIYLEGRKNEHNKMKEIATIYFQENISLSPTQKKKKKNKRMRRKLVDLDLQTGLQL
jgi:uncharacterized protein YqgQ